MGDGKRCINQILCLFLHFHLFIYLFIYLLIYLFICFFIYLFILLLSIYLFIFLTLKIPSLFNVLVIGAAAFRRVEHKMDSA